MQSEPIINSQKHGWDFDWKEPQLNGYDVYEIWLEGETEPQGRIAFRPEGGVSVAKLIEVFRVNRGRHGKHKNVGSHLFAIAALISFQAGFDGWIAFESKTSVMKHYEDLGAKHVQGPADRKMYFDTPVAAYLVRNYLEEE